MKVSLKARNNTFWHEGRIEFYATDAALPDNPIVGVVDLYDHDPLNLRAAVGIETRLDYRHRGYAAAMLDELHYLCYTSLSLHQLYADINDNNLISQRLFEHAGYRQVGLLHDWTFNGHHFRDAYRYQLLLTPATMP